MAEPEIKLNITRRTIDGPFGAFTHGFSESVGKATGIAVVVLVFMWLLDLPGDPAPQALPAKIYTEQDRPMKWHRIESAPEWEVVIVWDGDEVVAAVCKNGEWWSERECGDYENGMPMVPQPTHWMPMPQPPA